MKNITTDDFRFGTLVWGVVASFILGSIIWGVVLYNNNAHQFDIACINSNKKLTYITLEGESYSQKVCQ